MDAIVERVRVRRRAMRVVLAAGVVMVAVFVAGAGEPPAEPAADSEADAESEARLAYPGPAVTEEQVLELGRPGPEHEALAPMVGSWHGEVTYWPFPEAAPVRQEATAEKAWILGGRFLRIRFHSTIGGEPFEGVATVGFDRTEGRYVSTWLDSTSTGILHLSGEPGDDPATMVMEGERYEPHTGRAYRVRHVVTVEGDDAHVATFFDELDDGSLFKSLEIRWTRVAP